MDLRTPIGLLFTAIGALLAVAGWLHRAAAAYRPVGVDIDWIWGLVLLAFGIAMLALAWRAHAARRRAGARAAARAAQR